MWVALYTHKTIANFATLQGRLVWENPKRHRPWPPPRPASDQESGHEKVKREDEDIVIAEGSSQT